MDVYIIKVILMWKYECNDMPPCTKIRVGDMMHAGSSDAQYSYVAKIVKWDIFYCSYPDRFILVSNIEHYLPPWSEVDCNKCKYQDETHKGKIYTKRDNNE